MTAQSIQITTLGCELKLDQFSGPMDLLLHMIRENQLNIYDIPIAEITEAYLALVRRAQHIQYEIAGEFLVMASWLLYIKSRTLVPFQEAETEAEDVDEDPRATLTRKLLVYQQFQDVSQDIQARARLDKDVFIRDAGDAFVHVGETASTEIQPAAAFELSGAFGRLMRAFEHKLLKMEMEPINFRDFFEELAQSLRLRAEHVYDFNASQWTVERVVFTLLVFLELSKRRALIIDQDEPFAALFVRVLNQAEIQFPSLRMDNVYT